MYEPLSMRNEPSNIVKGESGDPVLPVVKNIQSEQLVLTSMTRICGLTVIR
jgi:hypothetical protein